MTTLRQRFDDYRRADDFPETPESFECSRRRQVAGVFIVIATGFVCSTPFAVGLLLTARSGVIPYPVAAVVGLGLYFVSGKISKYVGAPLADHVLGIPREVNA